MLECMVNLSNRKYIHDFKNIAIFFCIEFNLDYVGLIICIEIRWLFIFIYFSLAYTQFNQHMVTA